MEQRESEGYFLGGCVCQRNKNDSAAKMSPELNDSRFSQSRNRKKRFEEDIDPKMLSALSDEEADDRRHRDNSLTRTPDKTVLKNKIERSKTPVPETL